MTPTSTGMTVLWNVCLWYVFVVCVCIFLSAIFLAVAAQRFLRRVHCCTCIGETQRRMDLNSSEDDDEDVNDDCIILGVCKTSALRKRRRRKRLTPNPKRHKTVSVPVPLPTTAVALPQQKRARTREDWESDTAGSNSESDHEQFAFIPKRTRTAPDRFHIKTNRGTVGNLHRSYEEPKKEPPKEPKKEPPKEPPKEPKKEPHLGIAMAMRSPTEIVYKAILVQPDGRIGITIPRFTLRDGRAARQAQVSWIPVRYLEMLLFSRYDGGTTGVVFKMLQRLGLGPTSWIIGPAAVKRGEISQADAEFIICTFKKHVPSKEGSLLSLRSHVVSIIPVASATTICRDRGMSPESIAFLRAFAPREVSFSTAPPAPPQPADDDDDDDDDEDTPLSFRTKRIKWTEPPAVKNFKVARASWRVVKTPTPTARTNSLTSTLAAQTLTSFSLAATTSMTGFPVVESDQDSNATTPYGLASPPSLDEIIPYDMHAARAPLSSTTTTRPRPHSLNWERRSVLDLAEVARRELEAHGPRRAPTNRHFSKFKSSQPCRYGPSCRFRNEGCAFVHSDDKKIRSNDSVDWDVRGNLLPPFHESDRF